MSELSRISEWGNPLEQLRQVALSEFLDNEECVAVYHVIKKHQRGEIDDVEFCQELRHYLETTDCEKKGARPDLLTWAIYAETQMIA